MAGLQCAGTQAQPGRRRFLEGRMVRADELAQVEELLAAALPLSADAREALLATVPNPAVCAEVRSLLAADPAPDRP